MSKFRFLRTSRFRRFAAIGSMGFIWLALVCLLPRTPSNMVAAVGMVIAMVAYVRWADDPKERPTWGCLIPMTQAKIEIKFSAEVEAKQAAHRERQTLLRAAEAEISPEQELLRSAEGVAACTPPEMLRSSDTPE